MFQDRVTKNILYKVCKIKMQESTDNSEPEEKKKKTICTCQFVGLEFSQLRI